MTIIVSVHLKHLQFMWKLQALILCHTVHGYSRKHSVCCSLLYSICNRIHTVQYIYHTFKFKVFWYVQNLWWILEFFFSELEQASSHIWRKFIYKFMLFLLKFYAYVTVCHFMAAILCRMQCRNAVRVLFRITPGEK